MSTNNSNDSISFLSTRANTRAPTLYGRADDVGLGRKRQRCVKLDHSASNHGQSRRRGGPLPSCAAKPLAILSLLDGRPPAFRPCQNKLLLFFETFDVDAAAMWKGLRIWRRWSRIDVLVNRDLVLTARARFKVACVYSKVCYRGLDGVPRIPLRRQDESNGACSPSRWRPPAIPASHAAAATNAAAVRKPMITPLRRA